MPSILRYLPVVLAASSSVVKAVPATKPSVVNTTVCNGQTYVYKELAGYGYLPSDFRDRFGDSVSLGSSIAIDKSTWSQKGNVYEGIMYALPGMPDITNFHIIVAVVFVFDHYPIAIVVSLTNLFAKNRPWLEHQRHGELSRPYLQVVVDTYSR